MCCILEQHGWLPRISDNINLLSRGERVESGERKIGHDEVMLGHVAHWQGGLRYSVDS